MRKVLIIILLLVCLPAIVFSQLNLSGKVVDAFTHKPLAAVSVYLSNTSIGNTTNENGKFTIHNIPIGKYDLVVSCIGYETFSTVISSDQLQDLFVELKPKARQLEDVVVLSYAKDGWEKYGNFFLQNFIGTSSNAVDCKILNKDAVKFNYSKSKNILTAYATEPLTIENNALGYTIHYDLQQFSYDYNSMLLLYSGFPYFTEMKAKTKHRQKVWERRREEAYEGSVMHFMRALYRNKLIENKFEISKVIVQKEKNSTYGKNYIYTQPLSGDSIAYALDSVTVALEFPYKLKIIYKGRKAPSEYLNSSLAQHSGSYGSSYIQLMNAVNIQIVSNGSYYNPLSLIAFGYWAWSEKICNMLPFDFEPTLNLK
jgi:hypothetical protein